MLLLVVNENAVIGIRVDDEGIDVAELVCLARNVLLDQMVLPIASKNRMDLFSAIAADVWSKHDTTKQKRGWI